MSETSRTGFVQKNIIWGNVGSMITFLLSFVSRTVFIYSLGTAYLGINGLFTNILGLLAFSELGIGTAFNYSLYKPIATNDIEQIKSLMHVYKTAYRVIATCIAVVGIILVPFLPYLVNTTQEYEHLTIYYLIYLFNTVSSYFVTYKYSFVTASQKQYIITNINTIFTLVINVVQLIVLLVFRNFLVYLISQSIVQLVQKIIASFYIDKVCPILKDSRDIKPLDKETKSSIFKNLKALIIHKIGNASVHQTDNLIISVFTSTEMVGLVSNYTLLTTSIQKFTNVTFNSFTAGFGNLVAKESREKQQKVFNVYNYMGFWVFGFVTICFIALSQPFIELWIGREMQLDNLTMVLLFVCTYLEGQSLTLYNFKTAAGIFDDDKWVALVQAVVNLVVSIAAIKLIGLPGVYVGTIVQRIVCIIWKPIIVYKKQFDKSAADYFVKFVYYIFVVAVALIAVVGIETVVLSKVTILRFIIMFCCCMIVPNVVFYIFTFRTMEFQEMKRRIIEIVGKRFAKLKISK